MPIQSQTIRPTESETAGLCLLIVEDDEADAYLIRNAVQHHPSVGKVVRASDGEEALQMVDSGEVKPDLAFIDLHMPRKGGLELLIALSCLGDPGFSLVVLTSSTAPNDAIRSRLRGAMRVIAKPDSVVEMQRVLAEVIDGVCRDEHNLLDQTLVPGRRPMDAKTNDRSGPSRL